jgi:hypothetical protein
MRIFGWFLFILGILVLARTAMLLYAPEANAGEPVSFQGLINGGLLAIAGTALVYFGRKKK